MPHHKASMPASQVVDILAPDSEHSTDVGALHTGGLLE